MHDPDLIPMESLVGWSRAGSGVAVHTQHPNTHQRRYLGMLFGLPLGQGVCKVQSR